MAIFCNCIADPLTNGLSDKRRMLVLDAATPNPDKDSGSLDSFNYLKILIDLGYHVTFIPVNMLFNKRSTPFLQKIGVECVYHPLFKSYKQAIKQYAPSTNFILLYRASVAAPLVDLLRRLAPQAKILFNAVDLHHLRKMREAVLSKSLLKFISAKRMQYMERWVIRNVDATILLSTYEIQLASRLVPEARLYHLPTPRDIPGLSGIPWEERGNIVFIGGYNHPPNVDAVLYFIMKIWPHLRDRRFSGKFVIAGSGMPAEITSLGGEDIVIRGYVPDLKGLFGNCRLSVAPLRYGAGMKGKVISSLSHGVPCIATTIATEGTNLIPGENILVEDDPTKMAELIHKVYDDEPLWEKLSASGLNYCVNNCSIESIKEKLNLMLAEITC